MLHAPVRFAAAGMEPRAVNKFILFCCGLFFIWSRAQGFTVRCVDGIELPWNLRASGQVPLVDLAGKREGYHASILRGLKS